MAKLGKEVSEKTFEKVSDYLEQWLDSDEEIIGVFKASRWSPPSEGFALTNRRLLVIDKLILKINKIVDEIAADDIQAFTFEKGLLKARKLYVTKKDGKKIYLGSMYKDDSIILADLLPEMSGTPRLIAEKMRSVIIAKSDTNKHTKDEKTPQQIIKKKEKGTDKKSNNKKLIRNVGFVLFWPSFIAYRLKIGTELKEARIREARQRRESLHEDWKIIVATIAKSLKQHWDTLEVKFEQHIQQDDYGNEYIDNSFDSEIIYFSHKVVLPEIKKLIADGRIKYYSFESIQAPETVKENLYEIKFGDENSVIASKYVSGILSEVGTGLINDELLYALHRDDGLGFVSVENESNNLSNKANLLTLEFESSLQPNVPMRVTFISGFVFILFYAMFNSKPKLVRSSQSSLQLDFVGNDPYKYEQYIKDMLRSNGFQTRKTRSSGDFGVDVLASKNGKSYAIQCKLYNRPVGTKAIQEIVSGRLHYRADYALVVSDNKFTEAAKSLARGADVVLTHHKNLLRNIESLSNKQDQVANEFEVDHNENTVQKQPDRNQWTKDDADEVVTVILPTIRND